MIVNNLWIVKCLDGTTRVTYALKEPQKDPNSCTGYLLYYPGTADMGTYSEMIGLFGFIAPIVRKELENLPLPSSYNDDPLEVSLNIKSTYYA
jgi:hypothetical protein